MELDDTLEGSHIYVFNLTRGLNNASKSFVSQNVVNSSYDASGEGSLFHFPITDVYRVIRESYQRSFLGESAQIALIVVYSFLIFFGTVGNLLVAFVIGRKAELRTSRNLYIINLTVSDVSMCLVCMPFTLVGLLRKSWPLGNFICKLIPILQCTNILVSTATIVAIAADRYISIVCGTRTSQSSSYVRWSVVVIWAVSLAFSMPLFAYYYQNPVLIKDIFLFNSCIESWSSKVVKLSWTITLLLIQYIIPILVLSFVHANIKSFLSRNQTPHRDARKLQREIERSRRTTILLTSVALTFAVSWFPWHVVNFLADFHYPGFNEPEYFYVVFGSCHAMAMSTACSNPILYGWLNTNLKKELSLIIVSFVKQMTCSKCPRERRDGNRNAELSLAEFPKNEPSHEDAMKNSAITFNTMSSAITITTESSAITSPSKGPQKQNI